MDSKVSYIKFRYFHLFAFLFVMITIFAVKTLTSLPPADIFDEIITEKVVNSCCNHRMPYTITCEQKTFKLEYRVDFERNRKTEDFTAAVIITIQPGCFINPGSGLVMGPNGGAETRSETTADKKHDIIVQQYSSMDTISSPILSAEKLANKLSRLYSEHSE